MYEDFFSRHQRVALQFSSGKDSAACLYLLEGFWYHLDVVWCNPGNPTKETLAYMEKVQSLVPNFVEVKGQQPHWIRENGYPADVLPYEATKMAEISSHPKKAKFCSTEACCTANMWMPMLQHLEKSGYTGIVRGQKLADAMKTRLRSGDVVAGVEYLLPVETWSDAEVFSFLGDRVPDSYRRGLKSSLDCANCTGYVQSHGDWAKDLLKTAPEIGLEVLEQREAQRILLANYLKSL